MSKYSLTSIGLKIIAFIISAFISTLLVIFIVFNLSIIGIIFLSFLWLLLMLGNFLIYNHRIKIKKDKILIGNLKSITKNIIDIKSIIIIDKPSVSSAKHCYIKFIFHDNKSYTIVGYESILNKNSTIKTQIIINSIKKEINLLDI